MKTYNGVFLLIRKPICYFKSSVLVKCGVNWNNLHVPRKEWVHSKSKRSKQKRLLSISLELGEELHFSATKYPIICCYPVILKLPVKVTNSSYRSKINLSIHFWNLTFKNLKVIFKEGNCEQDDRFWSFKLYSMQLFNFKILS